MFTLIYVNIMISVKNLIISDKLSPLTSGESLPNCSSLSSYNIKSLVGNFSDIIHICIHIYN